MTAAFRISPVLLAASVANSRIGLLNPEWIPLWVRCAVTILLLDLLNYAAHRTFHSVSFLWRVHEVHHSDPDYDVSAAARFHPIEVGVQGAHLAVIALLASPGRGRAYRRIID
jgi:sterol desaturase/sphingolipid hydroxylase (fatty acid hydroxylase superfamily)